MSRRTLFVVLTVPPAAAAIAALLTHALPDASASAGSSDWATPVNLGPAINSPASEQHPALSKDGLSLCFTSDRPGGSGGLDLWVAQRESEDAAWGAPVNLGPGVNSAGTDMAPAFSPDGHSLYFHSDRAGGHGGFDLYVATRTHTRDDFGWGAPVNLGDAVNSIHPDAGPTLFVDEERGTTELYFTILNKPGGLGDWDVYLSLLGPDGLFGAPVNVAAMNSPYRDTRTAIRHDGREMIVTSERPGGIDTGPGRADLWVSCRGVTTDPWTTPVNLGDVVNSPFFDGAPALSWDAETLVFYSNRPGGAGGNDLWMTTRLRPAR